MSTADRHHECDALLRDVSPLVDEFVAAVNDWRTYDLRTEPFYDPELRKEPRARGTVLVTNLLRGTDRISVNGLTNYSFAYRHREVSPLRTPRGQFSDGSKAKRSGLGGIDYVGLARTPLRAPVLGEIKYKGDADPFYAFIQLLTYLSELSSEAQTARANTSLFDGMIEYPATWDLHILLADYNDRGARGPIVNSARDLVAKLKTALPDARWLLGRVLCLKMNTSSFDGALDLVWEE